jgi:hypothetical protein
MSCPVDGEGVDERREAWAIFTAIGKYIRQIFHPFTEHANSTQSHLKGNRRDATNSLGAVLTVHRFQIVLRGTIRVFHAMFRA